MNHPVEEPSLFFPVEGNVPFPFPKLEFDLLVKGKFEIVTGFFSIKDQ